MRLMDIKELLMDVDDNISLIEKEYKVALKDNSVKEVLKVKVKSCLENLRSCLDYSAHDIYNIIYKPKVSQNEKVKIYFPYGSDLQRFRSGLGVNFKNINSINKDIYAIIESIQPFKSNKNWLLELCNITNEIKHNQLTKQNRTDYKSIKMEGLHMDFIGGNTHITISGNTINGKKQKSDILVRNGVLISDLSTVGLDVVYNESVGFVFKDTEIEVIGLLKESQEEIEKFIEKLYPILIKIG